MSVFSNYLVGLTSRHRAQATGTQIHIFSEVFGQADEQLPEELCEYGSHLPRQAQAMTTYLPRLVITSYMGYCLVSRYF